MPFHGLPLTIDNAERNDTFTVNMGMHLPTLHATHFRIVPDDCLKTLTINGQNVRSPLLPFCGFRQGRTFDLSDYVHPGQNTLSANLFNASSRAGLEIYAVKTNTTSAFMIFMLTLFLSWLLWPYLYPHSPRCIAAILRSQSQRFQRNVQRLLKLAATVLLILASVTATYKISLRFLFELRGAFSVDSPLYWAVGRGILNGLIPYRDLFETKPPGIFLLSAFSYLLTDSPLLGHIIQAGIILGFPILLVMLTLPSKDKTMSFWRFCLMALSLTFGTFLALYIADRSGRYQVESYGAFFSVLYLCLLAREPERFSKQQTTFAAVCLLGAIGMKEPFLLSIAAASVFLLRSFGDFFHRFLIPLCLAAIAGILFMALLGYLQPYVHIYLNEMLGKHITSPDNPFLHRGLQFSRIWNDMRAFSPLLPWGIFFLVGSFAAHLVHVQAPLPRVFLLCGISIAAAYSTSLAVGMGGNYYDHHFVFAAPVYFALFIAFLRHAKESPHAPPTIIAAVTLILIFTLGIQRLPTPPSNTLSDQTNIEKEKTLASAIDRTLDRCGQERYLFLGKNGLQPFAYTKHSPLGPLFFQYGYLLGDTRPFFQREFVESLHRADIAVVHSSRELNTFAEPVERYLEKCFTDQPWPCSAEISLNAIDRKYQMFFRNLSLKNNPSSACSRENLFLTQ